MIRSAGEPLDLSLNEVEMIALKAARGAGMAWGMAEDAGRAARWLAGCGQDWAGSLLAVLDDPAAVTGDRSPVRLGIDIAEGLAAAGTVHRPIWTIATAVTLGAAVRLSLDGLLVEIGPDGVRASLPPERLLTCREANVAVVADAGTALLFRMAPCATRSAVRPEDHAALDVLVHRTYVPNSEQSRARGAGGV